MSSAQLPGFHRNTRSKRMRNSIRITKIMVGVMGASLWIALLSMASCKKDQPTVTPDEVQPGQPMAEDIEAEEEFRQQRQEFVSATEQRLQEIDRAIEVLEERGDRLEGHRKAELDIRIQKVKDRREQLSRRLDQAKETEPGAWESVTQQTEQAWNEVEESYNDARDYLQTSEAEQQEDADQDRNQ
jgi:TolA-binding protein